MPATTRAFPTPTALAGATVVAGTVAFVFSSRDASATTALLTAATSGLLTGLLLHRPRDRFAPDGRLSFRTPEQLRAARARLIEARTTHAEHLRERQGVRRRLADLRDRMRDVGLPAYSSRIATIDRGLATMDKQIAVIARLRDGYDRSLRMIDIELDAGHAVELLDEASGAAISDAVYELRLLEESQAELARQLEANDEVEGLLTP